jgi:serine/threonine protein kinase
MTLETSEFGRALEAVSDGKVSLDSLLTILTREPELATEERAARLGIVKTMLEAGRLSDSTSSKVVRTMFKAPEPKAPPGASPTSGPTPGSHPSNWSDWADNQPPAPPLTPGYVLRDRFVLEEVIGIGGMSIVFRALDRRREEAQDRQPHVAIKVLGDEFKRHPDALRALQRESRKTQRLAHPNIASVYDFDRDGSNVYMVMELLVGEPLDELLRRRGKLGLEKVEALRILSEMGAALAHAHGLGIVHSDFKPSNAFVTESGETKVIDFGVSRATKPKNVEAQAALTVFDPGKLGALTVAYCSPEQMLGDADPDPRDDVYALGVVAYELLSGRHPFGGRSALDAQIKGLGVEPVAGLTGEQNAALRAALECRREKRTDSVRELLQGLGVQVSTREPVLRHSMTVPQALPHVTIDETQLRPWRPATGVGVSPPATSSQPRESWWPRAALIAVLVLAVAGGAWYAFQQSQLRANAELDAQRRATREAQLAQQRAERLIEQERLARQKADAERLAAEEAAKRAARARAKPATATPAAPSATAASAAPTAPAASAAITSAPAAASSSPRAGTSPAADLQRALEAEEAEHKAAQSAAAAPAGTVQPTADAGAAPSTPAAAAPVAPAQPVKRTLYRWQDESGKVHYGAEVPEEYKDSAVLMLPGS